MTLPPSATYSAPVGNETMQFCVLPHQNPEEHHQTINTAVSVYLTRLFVLWYFARSRHLQDKNTIPPPRSNVYIYRVCFVSRLMLAFNPRALSTKTPNTSAVAFWIIKYLARRLQWISIRVMLPSCHPREQRLQHQASSGWRSTSSYPPTHGTTRLPRTIFCASMAWRSNNEKIIIIKQGSWENVNGVFMRFGYAMCPKQRIYRPFNHNTIHDKKQETRIYQTLT